MRLPERRTALLVACFFLSGAASLMAQVVWLRYLALTFGNTTQAAATLLAVFMGGLGLAPSSSAASPTGGGGRCSRTRCSRSSSRSSRSPARRSSG